MKRLIDQHLLAWKAEKGRKSLLIHGARQIGKTFAVRQLGKTYENYVEVNFERRRSVWKIFDSDLDPKRMIHELSKKLKVPIDPKTTLLFFDEIQAAPRAIIALRYFYEEMPELHIIAAGSLLGFATQQVGMPVGRVQEIEMYPLTFIEFLWATENNTLAQEIIDSSIDKPLEESSHQMALKILGEYLAVGGMPESVKKWHEAKDINKCLAVYADIIKAYRFKPAKKNELKHIERFPNKISFNQFINKSELVEAFTKQELIAYDHLTESPLGIKFSTQNYSVHGKIHSYPLYAVAAMVKQYWK